MTTFEDSQAYLRELHEQRLAELRAGHEIYPETGPAGGFSPSTGETYPLAEIGLDPFPLVDTTTVETIEYERDKMGDVVKVTTTTTVHQAPAAQ